MTQCKQSYEEIAIPCNVTVPTVVLQHHHCHVTRSQLSRYTVKTEMSKCQHCHVAFLQLLCKKNIITAVSQSQHCHVTNDIVSCHNVITTLSKCHHCQITVSSLSGQNITTVMLHCHYSMSCCITKWALPCHHDHVKKRKKSTLSCHSVAHALLCHTVYTVRSLFSCHNATTVMSKCQHFHHCHVQISNFHHCRVQMSAFSPPSCPNVNTFTTVMSKSQYFHHRNVQMSTLSPLSCPNVNTLNTVMSSDNNTYKHICDLMQCLLRHDYGNVQASRKPRTRVIIYSVT